MFREFFDDFLQRGDGFILLAVGPEFFGDGQSGRNCRWCTCVIDLHFFERSDVLCGRDSDARVDRFVFFDGAIDHESTDSKGYGDSGNGEPFLVILQKLLKRAGALEDFAYGKGMGRWIRHVTKEKMPCMAQKINRNFAFSRGLAVDSSLPAC